MHFVHLDSIHKSTVFFESLEWLWCVVIDWVSGCWSSKPSGVDTTFAPSPKIKCLPIKFSGQVEDIRNECLNL